MASSKEFVDYIVEQMRGLGGITCRKMFGEYGLHYRDKFFACICNNQLLLKITEEGRALLPPDCPTAPPYEGATPYFLIEDLDDAAFLQQLVEATCTSLPVKKPRKPKAK